MITELSQRVGNDTRTLSAGTDSCQCPYDAFVRKLFPQLTLLLQILLAQHANFRLR